MTSSLELLLRPAIAAFADPPRALLLLIALALTVRTFHPILRGYFFADDFLNLYGMRNMSLAEYLVTPLGGHLLVARNAIFWAMNLLFGVQAEYYFAVVLITHLVNVALAFRVIDLFTHSPRLACVGAALWGTCPLNAGALGWYSVYGNVVVVTIMLGVLCRLASVADGRTLSRAEALLWAALLVVASTSFGVGIGVTLMFPVVAFTLVPRGAARTRATRALAAAAAVVPVLYLALNRLYGALRPDVENVSSTLLRIVIDPRSWIPIFAFLLDLMRYGTGGPLEAFSNRIVDPDASTYVAAAIYLSALAVGFWIGTPRTRRQLAACLLLFVSCYALIAGGRVLFFVQAGTALAQTPRYHYAGPVFPITALCVVAGQLSQRVRLPGSVRTALLLLLLSVLLGNHSDGDLGREQAAARTETADAIRSIRRQIDQTPSGQDVYIENQRFAALGKVNIEEWTPGWAAVFVIFFPENTVDGKRVFFVEPNLKVVQAAQRGTRSRTLLISPRPLPSAPPPATHGQIPLGQQGAGTTGGSTVEVSRDGRFSLAGR